jgi:signal peptidase II
MRNLPLDNFRSPAALLRFAGVTAAGLAVDLWTKSEAVRHLKLTEDKIQFIPGWLHFEYTQNHGAVFGIGQGQRMLFLAVSVGAIAFLTWLFAASGRQRWYQVILGMLLAGVLGNMYDRIEYGYVRDMIHALPRWPRLFPWIFNVADCLLCVGVFLMIAYSLFAAPREVPAAATAPAPSEPAKVPSRATPREPAEANPSP